MKKLFILFFLLLLFTILCACSPVQTVLQNVDLPKSDAAKTPQTPQAITDYLRNMLDWKSNIWKTLEAKYGNTGFAKDFNSINAPDYSITILPMFDTLSLTGSGTDKQEGKLMLSGIPAYKETNGGAVTFGFDYTYAEDAGLYKKGTQETAKGILETGKGTLTYEDIVKANGQTLARTVIEIVKLSDASYAYQYLYCTSEGKTVSGVFCMLSKDALTILCGTKASAVDFSYPSILYGNHSLTDMNEGFTINLTTKVDQSGAEIVKN